MHTCVVSVYDVYYSHKCETPNLKMNDLFTWSRNNNSIPVIDNNYSQVHMNKAWEINKACAVSRVLITSAFSL